MRATDVSGIEQFIRHYPGMSIAPSRGAGIALEGEFCFRARPSRGEEIRDSYQLRIEVPRGFPGAIPQVFEEGGRIPRADDYHVNPSGTLCLGSPLRLRLLMTRKPSLVGFAEHCLVPHLYAVSQKLTHGRFPFGELPHGRRGIIVDYMELLRLKEPAQVLNALELLGKKRRLANKAICPCGCGRRLGVCSFNADLRKLRGVASRHWFRTQAAALRN